MPGHKNLRRRGTGPMSQGLVVIKTWNQLQFMLATLKNSATVLQFGNLPSLKHCISARDANIKTAKLLQTCITESSMVRYWLIWLACCSFLHHGGTAQQEAGTTCPNSRCGPNSQVFFGYWSDWSGHILGIVVSKFFTLHGNDVNCHGSALGQFRGGRKWRATVLWQVHVLGWCLPKFEMLAIALGCT